MPITRGNTAVTASSSRFRLRPKTSRSSEAKNLYIEALAGKADEQVFQARRGDREAADPDAGLDELGADPPTPPRSLGPAPSRVRAAGPRRQRGRAAGRGRQRVGAAGPGARIPGR